MAKSRRQSRAKRQDVTRQWQEGRYDEEHALKERWSREGRKPRQKVKKQVEQVFSEDGGFSGTVLEVHRRSCIVRNKEDFSLHKCRYGTLLVTEAQRLPAVGDEVTVKVESISEDFYVTEVLPRKTALTRPGPDDRFHRKLVLAANVDQVGVVASITAPDFNYGFVDRFLLAAELSNLHPIIVLNKVDLIDEIPEDVEEFSEIATIIPVSAHSGDGIEKLKETLKDKRSVFSGQSGVGKSSLISAIIPDLDLQTQEVRDKDGRGRHTTTSSSLFTLPFGGEVIDTPGIRGLGLMNLGELDLALLFPGFEPFTGQCRFNNCLHLHEPNCAVQNAVADGHLSAARYHSYVRIVNSIEA